MVRWSHGTQNVLQTKPFWKMANFIMMYQWQLTTKWRGKVRSADLGDLESVAEADTQHHSKRVAVLQMSEIATAFNITKISTLHHVFLRNFPYILNTLHFFYTTPLDGCFWVISNVFVSLCLNPVAVIFNNIYKKNVGSW